MRRRVGWQSLAGVALVALLMTACGDDDTGPSLTGTSTPTPTVEETTTAVPPTDLIVKAGMNDPDDATIAVLQFLPAKVTVDAGTPVTWSWDDTTEPHSVTFLAPGQQLPEPGSDPTLFAPTPATGPIDGTTFVNSGLHPLGPGRVQPLTLDFDQPGTYSYVCVIHPQMVGEVEVVASGGDSPLAVAERGDAEGTEYLAEGRTAKKAWEAVDPPVHVNDDGTKTYEIEMGTSTANTDILAFHATPTEIKAGDQVRFVNKSAAPHTASFFGTGAEPIQDPTDPRVERPAPGASPQVLAVAGFFNSGILPPDAPPGAGPPEEVRSFVFTVPKAGSYNYVCLLHAPSDMMGTIEAA